MHTIYYMPWDELERGWGRRYDGCSLHDTPESYALFMQEHSARQPMGVPDEYGAPALDLPLPMSCSPALAALVSAKKSLRLGKSSYRAHADSIEALHSQLLADADLALAHAERADIDRAISPAPKSPHKPSHKPSL